jgi:putative oxidoreductase
MLKSNKIFVNKIKMEKVKKYMACFNNSCLGVLLVRIAIGIVFINAGWMKVSNMEPVITGFASMGFNSALAYFVSYAELLGGALILVGLLTRYAAFVIAIIMLVAVKVLSGNGFSMANGGFEYPLVLAIISFGLVFLNSGKYSLDQLLCKKK